MLVRAVEPVEGLALMRSRRAVEAVRDLCRGPGRLCRAFDIDRALDGVDLFTHPALWLGASAGARVPIGQSRRIGVTRAASRRLRFYEAGSLYVSGPARLSPAARVAPFA